MHEEGRKDEVQMPKIKTHKATAKRFKVTKRGKVLRGKQEQKRRKMSKSKLREVRQDHEVEVAADRKRIRRLAPYLKRK